MKKYIKYLTLILLVVFIGVGSVNAACYKKTIKTTVGNGSTKTETEYTTSCKKNTSSSGSGMTKRIKKITCSSAKPKKCNKSNSTNTSNANENVVTNEDYGFSSPTGLAYIGCGNKSACPEEGTKGTGAYDIPVIIPQLTSYAVTLLKIVTPVILIIMGMVQLIKAIASQKEDEIKKYQSSLVKKVIIAVMIFFVISIVQFVISKAADSSESGSLRSCMQCFLNGTGDCDSIYYRDANGKCITVK